jgi:hypothetical protein
VRVLACAAFLSLLALTGCLTDSKPDPAQFEAADNEKCIGYGTTPGTPAYTSEQLIVRARILPGAAQLVRRARRTGCVQCL